MAKKNTPATDPELDQEQEAPEQDTPATDPELDQEVGFSERLAECEEGLTILSAHYSQLLSDIRESGKPFQGYRRVANAKFKLEGLVRATFPETAKRESKEAPSLFKNSGSIPQSRTIKNAPAPNLFQGKGGVGSAEIQNPAAPNLFALKGAGSPAPAPLPKKEKAEKGEKGGVVLASSEDKDRD